MKKQEKRERESKGNKKMEKKEIGDKDTHDSAFLFQQASK